MLFSAAQPFHPGDQVRVGSLEDKMEMVRHEAEAMDLPGRFLTTFRNRA